MARLRRTAAVGAGVATPAADFALQDPTPGGGDIAGRSLGESAFTGVVLGSVALGGGVALDFTDTLPEASKAMLEYGAGATGAGVVFGAAALLND